MTSIKQVFVTAFEQAQALNAEMQEEIEAKRQQIVGLEDEIDIIKSTKKETETFMSNLQKFV